MLDTILRGRYKIVKHLGGGGFGQTYLAEDIDLPNHPICVVKQLKPTSKEPFVLETAKRLFDKEAEILYSLGTHDQIPRLLAHFQESDEFYLVQEFADGNDLTQEIGKGIRFPEVLAIELIKEVLEILVFVHEHGVVHRDIKPANLIRRKSDGKIVLIDFGAVKEIGGLAVDSEGNTNLTIAIGSPGYMPTEQLNGKPRFSSDIYAVGMMGIQAITGAEPRLFGENPETAELIWRDRLPEGSYSQQFLFILDKMVRYDFRQRYQTAQEVLMPIASLPSSTAHNLQTVVTSNINEINGQQVDTVQVIKTLVDEQPNKKKLPWSKIAIAGGGTIAAVILAMVGYSALHKATPTKEATNPVPLIPQPTPVSLVTKSASPISQATPVPPSPSPVVTSSASPNSEVEALIREANDFRSTFHDDKKAYDKINEAIHLDPNNSGAYVVKGRILLDWHKEVAALAAFKKAVELKPNSPTAQHYVDELLSEYPKLKKL